MDMVKTITVTNEAYEAIKNIKESNESFSDLFNRISKKKALTKDLFGMMEKSSTSYEDVKRKMKEDRKRFNIIK